MAVTLELTFSKIILRTTDPAHEAYAMSIAGKVENKNIGEFTYSLSSQNLEKINKVFNGVQLPKAEVVKGHSFLQQMREKYLNYTRAKSRLRDIMKLETYPLEPNGKFFPYAHQTKIVGGIITDPFTFVAADCGTGKTGSAARAAEILLSTGEIKRGKILISAPLSILFTSWDDDVRKFTNLRTKILWAPMANKTLKIGDLKVIGHGIPEKPIDAITVKSKKGSRWVKGTVIKAGNLDIFEEAEGGWEKMQVSWKEAILADGTGVTFGPIYGQVTQKEKTKELWIQESLKDPTIDVFIINHDGVRIYESILKEHHFEFLIVDESTKIKSPSSQVYKSHVEISWNCKRRVTLSGTPNPNGFMDLWSQYYFLDRGMTLSTSLKDYRHDYFTPIKLGHFGGQDAVKWELRDETLKQLLVSRVRDASIFFKQRDCIDLPPRTDLHREVYMTSTQSKVYKEMEKELVAELTDQRTGLNVVIEAKNTLAKIMKLRQITSGYVGHADGIVAIESLANNPKLEELDSFIEELGDEKLVIACQFKEEIYTLLERYKHLGIAAIFGDESVTNRTENIKTFQTTNKIKIMVLQPAAAAHGITLTQAHYFMFLSLDYNFEFYYQTGKRIERLGQKNAMFVYHMLARTDTGSQTIDHDLIDILKSKSSDRDILFDGVSDTVDIAAKLKQRLIERVQKQQ